MFVFQQRMLPWDTKHQVILSEAFFEPEENPLFFGIQTTYI